MEQVTVDRLVSDNVIDMMTKILEGVSKGDFISICAFISCAISASWIALLWFRASKLTLKHSYRGVKKCFTPRKMSDLATEILGVMNDPKCELNICRGHLLVGSIGSINNQIVFETDSNQKIRRIYINRNPIVEITSETLSSRDRKILCKNAYSLIKKVKRDEQTDAIKESCRSFMETVYPKTVIIKDEDIKGEAPFEDMPSYIEERTDNDNKIDPSWVPKNYSNCSCLACQKTRERNSSA